MIRYLDSAESVSPDQLRDFFEGWPNPPSAETHLDILKQSYAVVLAKDDETGMIVGFLNAISDGILTAYLPLLEVVPDYRKQGIGSELVRRMLDQLKDFYMIDLMCLPELQPFYARFGMPAAHGMAVRNFDCQNGRPG
jgi:GNAT superfamily N-acetyltransferase